MYETLVNKLQIERGKSFMDSRSRSIIKAITWRIFALLITIIVSFAILGSWSVSIAIGILSNLLKTLFYYIHERLWERTNWGKV
jgi:adenylylsulfate kinase